MWWSEDNWEELILSFKKVHPGTKLKLSGLAVSACTHRVISAGLELPFHTVLLVGNSLMTRIGT